jgi:hypothetical protein
MNKLICNSKYINPTIKDQKRMEITKNLVKLAQLARELKVMFIYMSFH